MTQTNNRFGVTTDAVIAYVSRLKNVIGQPNQDLDPDDIDEIIDGQSGKVNGILVGQGYNIASIVTDTNSIAYMSIRSLIARLSALMVVRSIYEPEEIAAHASRLEQVEVELAKFEANPSRFGIQPATSKVVNGPVPIRTPQAVIEINSTCKIEHRW